MRLIQSHHHIKKGGQAVSKLIRPDDIGAPNYAEWKPDPSHPRRRPPWITLRAPKGENYKQVRQLMRQRNLHTVCEEASCPNLGECWGNGTATFLMMGDTCTRACGFCNVKTGQPNPLDWAEPNRIAQSVRAMNLRHA